MRTTVNLDEEQVKKAREYAAQEKIAVSRAVNHYVKLGQERSDIIDRLDRLEQSINEMFKQPQTPILSDTDRQTLKEILQKLI